MSGREAAPAVDAVLLDMDGVITDTASAHMAAWKAMFDPFLAARGQPPFTEEDYRAHVDGKPRVDGVRAFLAARGIALEEGDPADAADADTVAGLAKRKQHVFERWLEAHPVRTYPGTIRLINDLKAAGIAVAVFSSSRNAERVLESAGIIGAFGVRVDGLDLARLSLPGKPEPAMLLEAASQLGIKPERAAVIEDARSGIEAARRGGFGLVIGVDRGGNAAALAGAGAHIVVGDLAELALDGRRLVVKTLASVPAADEDELRARLAGRVPAVFLDYDGTLTPIVSDHTKALLSEEMRAAIATLARACRTAIVSGRDLATLRRLVALDSVFYAGSHGFEIAAPDGSIDGMERGVEFLPDLDAAEAELGRRLADIPGHSVERKRFSIAVHYRNVAEAHVGRVTEAVDAVLATHPRLARGLGKKVYELQPRIDWNKGRAVEWLIERLGLDREGAVPIYIGDDITDEHAFRALAGRGVTIVVRDREPRPTAADLGVEDVAAVGRLLRMIAEVATARRSAG